ncbi:MAG: DNA polymerase III subunit delta', partial [Roseovarius sp.]
MSEDGLLPEPDRVEGAPHPRETVQLFGQDAAESEFLDAFNTGRLHHGWLITGPRGVGKATLAWRIARFLLATPLVQEEGLFGAPPAPVTLDVSADHPVARRMLALSDPGLFLLRRGPTDKGDRLAAEIRVSEVRKLGNFF